MHINHTHKPHPVSLGDSLRQFLPCPGLPPAVSLDDAALRVAKGTGRKARIKDLHQLETAELECEV